MKNSRSCPGKKWIGCSYFGPNEDSTPALLRWSHRPNVSLICSLQLKNSLLLACRINITYIWRKVCIFSIDSSVNYRVYVYYYFQYTVGACKKQQGVCFVTALQSAAQRSRSCRLLSRLTSIMDPRCLSLSWIVRCPSHPSRSWYTGGPMSIPKTSICTFKRTFRYMYIIKVQQILYKV